MPKGKYDRTQAGQTPEQPMSKEDAPLSSAPRTTDEDKMAKLEQMLASQQERSDRQEALLKELTKEGLHRHKEVDTMDPKVLSTIMRAAKGDLDKNGAVRDNFYDPQDELNPAQIVFTNKRGIYIEFLIRNGMRVGLPDGVATPMRFEDLSQDIEEDTLNMSYRGVMVINRKSVLEAMKKDDRWGTVFFEDQKVMNRMDRNTLWTTFYNTFHRTWVTRDEGDVMLEVRRLNINTSATTTNREYRELIASALADEAVLVEEEKRKEERLIATADNLLKQGTAQPVTA